MKKIILTFISFVIYFNSFNLAHAAVGGWDLKNPVAQGASTVYDATKNVIINGKKYIKESSVKITPTATQVAKVLARGGAGYALSVAVEQLLGSVDWVLDPANNRIIYYKDPEIIDPNSPTLQKRWCWNHNPPKACGSSPASAGQAYVALFNHKKYVSYSITIPDVQAAVVYEDQNGQRQTTYILYAANPHYNPNAEAEREEKYLPLPVVAEKVISNAESGDTNAQAATTAAAADIVAEAEKDDAKARPIASQAEANATTKPADAAEAEKANEAQGEAKPNEANPEATDLSITFPIFCNWAPTICEAAQVVISFPNTLTEWWESANQKADDWATSISQAWTAAKEWASTENKPDDESTEVDIIPDKPPALDTGILTASGQCPPDFSYPFPLPFGGTHTISYSYATACYWFSKLYFVVITVASVISYKIVTGTQGRSEDG